MTQADLLQGFVLALFCGASVGVEREFGKGIGRPNGESKKPEEPPGSRNPAGIRTHTLIALLGAVLEVLDQLALSHAFVLVGLAASTLIATSLYAVRYRMTGHAGATSSVTLVLTYVLGALSLTDLRLWAAGLAVAATAVLAVKAPLHGFIRSLTQEEFAGAVKLGLVFVVLLPLLPNKDFGPGDWPWLRGEMTARGVTEPQFETLAVFNPFKLWFLVGAISAVSFAGYVLTRALGESRGLALAGAVGGLVSSTAVTLSMAHRSKSETSASKLIAAAVLAACTVMSIRVTVIVLGLAPSLVGHVGLAMIPAAVVTAAGVGALSQWGHEKRREGSQSSLALRTPFAILPALRLTAVIFAVLCVSSVLTVLFGNAGLIVAALLAGLVDVDGVTVAACAQAAGPNPTVTQELAAVAILVGVTSNTLVKSGILFVVGSRPMAKTAGAWLLGSLIAGGVGVAAAKALLG